MRSAALVLLLGGGCLIVRTHEEVIDPPCPDVAPELLTTTASALALSGDSIYFIRAGQMLSRIATTGGPVTDLAPIDSAMFAIDANYAYWPTLAGDMVRASRSGGNALVLGNIGGSAPSALAVDDIGVVWVGGAPEQGLGVFRLRHDDRTIEPIIASSNINGLALHRGSFYVSDTGDDVVRRAPPLVDLAYSRYPGIIAVDDIALYFHEIEDFDSLRGSSIKLIPPTGNAEPITTVSGLRYVQAMGMDAGNLYFVTTTDEGYRINKVSRFGGAVTPVVCGPGHIGPVSFAHDDFNLYYADTRALYRVPK